MSLFGIAVDFFQIRKQLNRIEGKIDALTVQGGRMAASLDEILDAATNESTKVDSVISILQSLKDEQDPAKKDAILAQLLSNRDRLQAAIDANTTA